MNKLRNDQVLRYMEKKNVIDTLKTSKYVNQSTYKPLDD